MMNPRCSFTQHLLRTDAIQLVSAQLFKLNDAVLQHVPQPSIGCPSTESPTDEPRLQHLHHTTNRILGHSLCASMPRRIRRHNSHRPTDRRVHSQVKRPNVFTPRHEASRYLLHLPSRQHPTHNLARPHRPSRVLGPCHECAKHSDVLKTADHTRRSLAHLPCCLRPFSPCAHCGHQTCVSESYHSPP